MNQQLAAHQQLTLQAFQSAVDSYQQRGIVLPEKIAPIADTLESHIAQLDSLSASDPHFEMLYQAFRSGDQNDSSQRAKFLDTSAPPSRSTQNGFHAVEIKPNSNGHSSKPVSTESNGHTKTGPPPAIKRFVLPLNATAQEREHFTHYISQLQQLNPQWMLSPDLTHPDETEAYVMIPNDENYEVNYAAYSASQMLTSFFQPSPTSQIAEI
jgi:hypothetical protein